MQGATHFLAGVLIATLGQEIKPRRLQTIVTGTVAFLSHGVLDRLAVLTYHPPFSPSAIKLEGFWILYHLIAISLSAYVFMHFWHQYKLGLIFSILPDVDWLVIHTAYIFSFSLPDFLKQPIIHNALYSLFDHLPVLNQLKYLSNRSLLQEGALIELGIILVLALLIHYFPLRVVA